MKAINLSPSFLSKVYAKGYDYAVAEKLGLIQKDTKAMSEGRLIHAMLDQALGGGEAKFVVSPYDNYRTKEARDWRDSIPDNTAIVSQDRADMLKVIVTRVLGHEQIKPFLQDCEPEKTITKDVNGFTVKGIVDVISKHNSGTWLDFKFVSSKNFDKFTKEALWSHYDLQAAVYDYLTELPHGYFIVIESELPHRIQLYHCDLSFLDSGAEKFNKAVNILKDAKWREPTFDIEEVGELIAWGY